MSNTNDFYVFHWNIIKEIGINSSDYTLLSHPLFYLQNSLCEKVENKVVIENGDFYNKASKTLLILHSLPFNFNNPDSFFNNPNKNNGGFEIAPYGYLCLLGGLLYREKIYNETKSNDSIEGIDILTYKCKENAGQDYIFPTIEETYYVNNTFSIIKNVQPNVSEDNNENKTINNSYIKTTELIKVNNNKVITNKLINLFIDLVNEIGGIIDSYGLKLRVFDKENNFKGINNCGYSEIKEIIKESLKYKDDIKALNLFLRNENTNNRFRVNDNIYEIENFYKFAFSCVKNNKLLFLYKESDTTIQNLLNKLYNHKVGVITNFCVNNTNVRTINSNLYNIFVEEFSNTIQKLCKNHSDINDDRENNTPEKTRNDSDEDIKKLIYLTIKQFWDKWFCSLYNKDKVNNNTNEVQPFTVKWFDRMFLFIDSFYIKQNFKIKLNCSKLLSRYEGTSKITTDKNWNQTFLHLANVASDHNCDIFCYPDFLDFSEYNNNGKMSEAIKDMFRPLPYSQLKRNMECENRFIIMRTYPAQYAISTSDFISDGWDINQNGLIPIESSYVTENTNIANPINQDNLMIPSFGVCFGRRYNHIFKGIEISTESMQITDQALKSMDLISELGNDNKRNITYYGSDIFNVYSNYSYIVTITMMGNVQVQPLMYFQLMNVPMFHGVYMVIEVRHSIKPGDFTTTIRGMKLSRIMTPPSKSWFLISNQSSDGVVDIINDAYDNCKEEELEQ